MNGSGRACHTWMCSIYWPLNALILPVGAAGHFVEWIDNGDAKRLADALIGTIHAVYDAEGYMVWLKAG